MVSLAVALLGLTILPGCYLGHVAAGQLRVLRARTPIADVLVDPAVSRDEKQRLALVLEVRVFARSLGLAVDEQYTSYAAWPGDRLVTAVVAAQPGTLEAAGFWFPIVGRVPYKSYFSLPAAEREAASLRADGLDVCLSPVAAYSTLGWMADPVTGPLLRAAPTDLVATVIHELVHATIYVPGDADFNEGLATFIGQQGALAFFAARDGTGAPSVVEAQERIADERALSDAMGNFRSAVAALYAASLPGPERDAERGRLEARTRAQVAALPLRTIDAPGLAARLRMNDACLVLEGTYTADLPRYAAALAHADGELPALVRAAEAAARTQDPRATLLER